MLTNLYAWEKLRELEAVLASRALRHPRPSASMELTLRPLMRAAGRALRWAGEGLESWGTPATPQSAAPRPELRRATNG